MRPNWQSRIFIEGAKKLKKNCTECGRSIWLPPSKVNLRSRCGVECWTVWLERRKAAPKVPGWHAARFTEDPAKVSVKCLECARPMWLPQSKVSEYSRCGPECKAVWQARVRDARKRKCETCGNTFYPRPAQLRVAHGRFCSQVCNVAGRQALASTTSQEKSAAKMRELRGAGLVKFYRGEENVAWKGGKQASLQRRIESGKTRECLRRYRKANPDKVREWTQTRTARKTGRLPRGTVKRIGEAQKWKCAICRCGVKKGYHVDHVKPLALGGEHQPKNIQLLCKPCNLRKNARDPIDYMQSLGRLL